ncbi:MAG: hypothetical protein OEU36_24585 [Gammaproteobacteria bacterium]|nr:hypothetical protein [Gammaproteobacteria bacterium]
MRLAETAKLFVIRMLWQWTGLRRLGDQLVQALGSEDENIRTIAGMFLVQTGRRSRPLLEETLDKQQHLPVILTILGDIEDLEYLPKLEKYTQDPDSAVAQAARDAIEVVKLREQKGH